MLSFDVHGKNPADAIREVAEENNRLVSNGQRGKLVIVHGYGSTGKGGAIKDRLRRWLDEHALDYLCGELAGGNPGITVLILERTIPLNPDRDEGRRDRVSNKDKSNSKLNPKPQHDVLCAKILEFCTTPRPLKTIIGKFRRSGEPVVQDTVKSLEKQGLLQSTRKGKHTCYMAVSEA